LVGLGLFSFAAAFEPLDVCDRPMHGFADQLRPNVLKR